MRPKNIKIGGKSRPVYFGFAALRKFEELTGIPLSKIDKALTDPTLDVIIKFIYAGLYGGYKKKSIQIDFKMDDIENWLDDYGLNKLNELMEVYMSCMPFADNDEGKKKKVATKQVNP